jgi:DNA-binding IclR family transcriptional regulator
MHGNQSPDRALDVIQLLDKSADENFGVREIVRRLDLAVSIVQRLRRRRSPWRAAFPK